MVDRRDQRGPRQRGGFGGIPAGRALHRYDDDDDDNWSDEGDQPPRGYAARRDEGYNRGYHRGQNRGYGDMEDNRRNQRGQEDRFRNDDGRGRGIRHDDRREDDMFGGHRGAYGNRDRGGFRDDNRRGGGRGAGGGRRNTRPRQLDRRYLEELKNREASDIVLTIASPHIGFRDGLIRCTADTDLLKIMLTVLAKAFTSVSTSAYLTMVLTIIKEVAFFDISCDYFLNMQNEDSVRRQESFKQPIMDMITIMEELIAKSPSSVTMFVGIHVVLEIVIDALRETSDIIDEHLLKRFREFTERKDRLLRRTRRKDIQNADREREQDIEGPPEDFRMIEIFPQVNDMEATNDTYLRANKKKGRYEDLDHYLDVQFRLLREDFVGPLRDGIGNYIETIQEQGRNKKKLQDVRIYHSVKVITPECGDNGLCHVLQFDVSRLGFVNWHSSKRLIFGSLVCLSPDNFKTFYFATVNTREPKDLEKGLVKVRFEHDHETVKTLFNQLYTMAETTAYFESYRHVLTGLQKITQGDLPFEKYIIACDSDVDPPLYLRRRQDAQFDLRPLVDDNIIIMEDRRLERIGEIVEADHVYRFSDRSAPANNVTLLAKKTWPSADLLHLDDSQYRAIQTALTKEFVITQGPPGTGKTYIGLKIVKALLHNRKIWSVNPVTLENDLRPMLIVCYTNHALDQFLEGIIKFYKGDVLRVGGRSNSEILKDYNIHNFRQRMRHAQKVPVQVFQGRREAKNEMNSLTAEINKISNKIQLASTGILHEDFLQPFIGQYHYQLLIQQFQMMLQVYPEMRQIVNYRGFSILVEWLGFGDLSPIVEMEGNMEPQIDQQYMPPRNQNAEEDELIDVEEEVDVIQRERQLDDGEVEDDDFNITDLIDEFEELTPKQRNEIRVQMAYTEQKKAVALDAQSFDRKPKNSNEGEWQKQKQERKKMKRKMQRNISSCDAMTEEEARQINDMWRLPIEHKWRLYRLWIKKYCDHLIDEIGERQDDFEAAAGRYREALMQEDKEIMRQSTIIGMTTTGAARYQSVLQEIKPRIIVVEEAAEVLEAHIITTLSRGCEQLILIGDHKQLKPNPTVFKLATDYNLDVSLFERMISNGVRCDCLELQHRMRPEIAELMLHIYDNLHDHDDVKTYENIKGISSNIFFINHGSEESHDEDLRSHSNQHEADYIVGLCSYLLLQGYRPEQITVLTMYSGQLFCLRKLMPKDRFEGVRVTVVDNYQGEENDIILMSLVRSNEEGSIGFLKIENRVCVALSRAKMGFYAIGNFDLLADKSRLWNEVTVSLKQNNRFGDGLALYCQNHPDSDGIYVKTCRDFDRAPEGGCDKKCEFRLPCGHVCESFCHVKDQEHLEYECRKRCGKIVCKNGHRCMKRCSEGCSKCTVMVAKRIPKCGHTQQVPCQVEPESFACKGKCKDKLPCGHDCQDPCGNAHTDKCSATVEKSWPGCGHTGKIKCYQKDQARCPHPCDAVLGCEHQCTGTCGKCVQGRLHQPCKNDCIRILICGHECKDICNQCPPCTSKCENRCNHSKCGRRCGELCAPCMEPCEWRCEHQRCRMYCSEPCDRPRCNKPCKKKLTRTCKHPCIGLCGEPCPTDCRICDKEKVTALLFGDEDEPDARFVVLEDCRNKCIIESKAMDKYMDQEGDSEAIKLKDCPLCRTPIRKSRRYGTMINKTLQDIEKVKRTVLTDKDRIKTLEDDIRDTIVDEPADLKVEFKRRLTKMNNPKSENALAALKNQLTFVNLIKELQKKWETLSGVAYLEEKKKGLLFLEHFQEWVMEERTIMTPQETADAELEVARSQAHINILLHQKKLQETQTTITGNLRLLIAEAERLLASNNKYTEDVRVKVETCLAELKKVAPLAGIGVTKKERAMIVNAMALPKGHWFKCPQGHVYAIGDCGGATNAGRCPECKSEIGGTNYQLREGNQLAGEMDGAEHPDWSDEANLMNNDPFIVRH